MTVFVDIRWVDTRTGRTIVERQNIMRAAEFIVPRNETAGTSGNEAFVGIAQSIVEAMGMSGNVEALVAERCFNCNSMQRYGKGTERKGYLPKDCLQRCISRRNIASRR